MEDQELKKYEVTLLLKEDIKDKIEAILSKNGAVNLITGEFKKIQLAYPIKKENFAFIGDITFEILPSEISKISNDLKVESSVLRYLITKLENLQQAEENKNKNKPYSGSYKKERRSVVSSSSTMLTNETLEKQIEEILK